MRAEALIGGNSSVSYGGGIWTFPTFGPETIVNIEGGTIAANTANYGGGISMGEIFGYTPLLTISGGQISGNTALTDGGGIIAKGSAVTIAAAHITDNSAGRDGGGIFADQPANVTVYPDAFFSGNSAGRYVFWQVTNGGDSDIYSTHVFANRFSSFIPVQTPPPEVWFFTNAYNNYDVNYFRQPIIDVTVNLTEAGNPTNLLHTAILNSFLGATVVIPPRDEFTDVNGTVWLLEPPNQPARVLQLSNPDADYSVTFYSEPIAANVTVTEYYVNTRGRQLMPSTQTVVEFGGNYSKSSPPIIGYSFVGYSVNNGPLQTGAVNIMGISADTTVAFVYVRHCSCFKQ